MFTFSLNWVSELQVTTCSFDTALATREWLLTTEDNIGFIYLLNTRNQSNILSSF